MLYTSNKNAEKIVIASTIKQSSLSFYDKKNQMFLDDIWALLKNGLWKEYNIDYRISNNKLGETKQCQWKSVFTNIEPIYPGYKYDANEERLIDDLYFPKFIPNASFDTFIECAYSIFSKYKNKRIGVHLSGGLDSSLIICLLDYFNIPFVPIGLQSNRFEFRTEKIIQELLLQNGTDGLLLDFEDYPFYSKLEDTPKHQIPDSCIKMNLASQMLAKTFKSKGVDVVFTGQGADTLFVEAINKEDFNIGYNIGNEFTFSWDNDLIYSPLGIELVPFFANKDIISIISSLRIGSKCDPKKLWARLFFKDILPKELSEYSYCADFFGLSMSGLEEAKANIKMLFEEAYDYTGHSVFNRENSNAILSMDMFSLEYSTYSDFCSRISIAVWLHSLFRNTPY